jgi:hydroxyacylglutathione hydrolase
MAQITDFGNGISAIDGGFGRAQLAAIHLLVERDRAALVDTGTFESVPRVLEALTARDLTPEQVDYVILTHIHLDHAGGAGLLMQELPNAVLAVHPRGARHMADPAKLVAGTVAVYGEAAMRRMYGEIVPVPARRIVETADGCVLRLAGRELLFLDTPGHARHHICMVDRGSGHIFTGDTFGLSYRELDCDGRQFVFPTTTPVQFDPEAMHRSIERLLTFRPEAIYVAHYSQVREVPRLAADLHRLIDAHVDLALSEKGAGEARRARLEAGINAILLEEARRYRWTIERERLLALMAMDVGLNAQGLDVWLDSGR